MKNTNNNSFSYKKSTSADLVQRHQALSNYKTNPAYNNHQQTTVKKQQEHLSSFVGSAAQAEDGGDGEGSRMMDLFAQADALRDDSPLDELMAFENDMGNSPFDEEGEEYKHEKS